MKHRLAKILQERGTSTRLAEKTGMKPSVISELCSGKIRIHEGHIDMICDALNIPAWHLFADPDEIFPEAYKELISAYLSLDEDDKRVVDKFMFPHKQQSPPANIALNPPAAIKNDSTASQKVL